ncbi:MAG: hypothetical protein ACI971_002389 [Colwellia sp.]|jgi:hypothetical protein
MHSLDLFVKNWGSKQSMTPINSAYIAEIEQRLAAILPNSYKYLLSNYGLVHTPNVLSRICDLGVNISEVQDFLSLEDVYSLSKLYEMSGMPKGHILFASDCKGNMFCFKLSDCERQQIDIPVWFFDHQLHTVKKISPSFIEWLGEFNKL